MMVEPSQPGLLAGVSAALRGLRRAAAQPEVRRTYGRLVAAIVSLSLVLDGLGIWAVVHLTASPDEGRWWLLIALLLMRLAGVALVLLAAPVVAVLLVNALLPMLAEQVFFSALRTLAPKRAAELQARPGRPWVTAALDGGRRLLVFVLFTVTIFLWAFVPWIGSITAPVLQAYLAARLLGWELLEPYFDRLGLGFAAQWAALGRHHGGVIGFALPLAFLMAVPLIGPLLFGLAQGAAASLVVDVIEHDPRPPGA